MRNVSLLIGFCMIVGLALTVIGQEKELQPLMMAGRTDRDSLVMNLMNKNAAGVAADAEKLQATYTKAGEIFKQYKSDAAFAISKALADDAAAVASAAKANNLDAAAGPAGALQKRCGACHMAHREQLPDKTFKFKP
jgi:hypothetical protein